MKKKQEKKPQTEARNSSSVFALQADVGHWEIVFLIAALIYLIGGLAFLFMASGEEQDFNRVENIGETCY